MATLTGHLPLRAVILDFNGTVSDDEPLLYRLLRDALAEQGVDLTEDTYFGELAGHSDPEIVELLTEEGPARVRRLLALGARFDRDRGGHLALGREAAHSRRRILHAHGDATGAEIVRALTEAVRRSPMFAGFCYTQFADTYQETNGLLRSDRTPKFPLERIALATRGARRFSDIPMPPAPVNRPPLGAAEEGGDEDVRIAIAVLTRDVLARALALLGVEAPDSM